MDGKNQDMQVGKWLKDKRLENNLSQFDIATRLGYSNSNFVSRIELGHAKIPLENILNFADQYGIDRFTFLEKVLPLSYPVVDRLINEYVRLLNTSKR